MASTNKTDNLKLSQFLGTDKPAWLTDYNADMQKIDDGYKKQADDIAGLDGRTTDLETGLSNSDTEIVNIQNDVQSLKDEDVIIKRDINTLATNYDTIHHEVAVNTQSIVDIGLKNTQQDEEIQGIKDGYLPLSGGTVNGLLQSKYSVRVQKPDFEKGVTKENNTITFEIRDKNNKELASLGWQYNKDLDYTQVTIHCSKNSTDNIGAYLSFRIDSNNELTFNVPQPKANSNSQTAATTAWVRNLLVSLGISGAAASNSLDDESEGSV